MSNDFLEKYCSFANSTTSDFSKDDDIFFDKALKVSKLLNGKFSRLDTAISGISGEAGEIADVWKKIKFHGKEFDEENKNKLIDELSDMFWYLAQASIALDVPMEEIINKNIEKLKKRHPNGFSNIYMK